MQEVAEETYQMYQTIIKEVTIKLKQKSERGFLQMSESAISQFKELWEDKLKKLRSQEHTIQQISKPINKQHIETHEPDIIKKVKMQQEDIVKTEEPQELEVKSEDDDNGDNDQSIEVSFENADSNQEQNSKQDLVKLEDIQQNRLNEKLKNEKYQKEKHEKDREKTLFDKIRELNKLQKEKLELQADQESDKDQPRVYDVYIYAQKNNQEAIVSRIKPNKTQKANLENVLLKEKNKDTFLQSVSLSFNFKTNNSSR